LITMIRRLLERHHTPTAVPNEHEVIETEARDSLTHIGCHRGKRVVAID
jgi:hypothetical protein